MKKNTLVILILLFLSSTSHATQNNINSYFKEAKKLFDEKKYENAKFYFEKDIVFNPKSEKSYLYLAKIFKANKKSGLEENNLDTVLLINPKNEEAIYLLTLLNIKKSNFSKARELITTFTAVCKKMCSTKKELEDQLSSSLKSK
tara:strand:+ start:109 stop:543 length:435 start_codon:yes stop_codon:yes gene_type:complete